MSTKQVSLLIFAVMVTTTAILALIVGIVRNRNTEPTMLTNGLDVMSTGSWILWSNSRLRAHVDTAEQEIRTDVVYATRGLRKVE